jgi:hypothetical protein
MEQSKPKSEARPSGSDIDYWLTCEGGSEWTVLAVRLSASADGLSTVPLARGSGLASLRDYLNTLPLTYYDTPGPHT